MSLAVEQVMQEVCDYIESNKGLKLTSGKVHKNSATIRFEDWEKSYKVVIMEDKE